MEFLRRSQIMTYLLVLTLIMAGISPACKFISGKTGMDMSAICLGMPGADMPDTTPQASSDDCAFCLVNANLKLILAGIFFIQILQMTWRCVQAVPPVIFIEEAFYKRAQPRGPPTIL